MPYPNHLLFKANQDQQVVGTNEAAYLSLYKFRSKTYLPTSSRLCGKSISDLPYYGQCDQKKIAKCL